MELIIGPEMPQTTMTGDEYMELLVERQCRFHAENPRSLSPLLKWFIRSDEVNRVLLPEPARKPAPTPRVYLPAAHWREKVATLKEQTQQVAAQVDTGDRAAASGCALGPKRTSRFQEKADRALNRYVHLSRRKTAAEYKLRAAEAREMALNRREFSEH